MKNELFKINFGHFDVFIWSNTNDIVDDLKYLRDESGVPLSEGRFKSITHICSKCEILEKGTGNTII
jgi:hypothetical protein